VTIHDVIDKAERELGEKYNMTLVIHMDPLGPESTERLNLRKEVKSIVKLDNRVISIHDFLILQEGDNRIIEFHVVAMSDKISSDQDYQTMKKALEKMVDDGIEGYKCRIILDIDFNGERENDL